MYSIMLTGYKIMYKRILRHFCMVAIFFLSSLGYFFFLLVYRLRSLQVPLGVPIFRQILNEKNPTCCPTFNMFAFNEIFLNAHTLTRHSVQLQPSRFPQTSSRIIDSPQSCCNWKHMANQLHKQFNGLHPHHACDDQLMHIDTPSCAVLSVVTMLRPICPTGILRNG